MKGSSLSENHLLKVNISFHVVNLVVKFACDIVLALKTKENKLICETLPRPLAQGRCQINQQLQLQWQSIYDVGRSEYLQTSMQIVVMVNSINGTIQAGICSLDIARIINKSTFPLKKCSDKSASICLSTNYEFLQVQQKDHFQPNQNIGSAVSSPTNNSLKRMKSLQLFQKNEQSLSISKISISNKRLQSFLRGENEQLQRQCEILEGKLKLSEKRQKQLAQQLKQHVDKHDKVKNRSQEIQNYSQTNTLALAQKERLIKNYESQLKTKKAELNQAKECQIILQKKLRQKQQAYTQQTKKLSEKSNQQQIQLQQAALQYNRLLQRYEEMQKNMHLNIKEREKVYILQKSKMAKQLINQKEYFTAQLQKSIHKLKETASQIQQLSTKQTENAHLLASFEQTTQQLKSIRQQNAKNYKRYKETEEQLLEMKRTNQQRFSFRKKINDIQSQNNSLKIQIEKINQNNVMNNAKLTEYNQRLEECQSDRKKKLIRIQELNTVNINIKNKCSQLQKQVSHCKQNYQKLVQAQKELKKEKQQTQFRLKEQLQEWGRQVQMLAQQKSRLQAQNGELRWEIQQFESGLRQSQSTTHTYKTELFQLTKQLIFKTQQYQQIQIQIKQIQQRCIQLQQKLQQSQSKVRQLINSNSQKASLLNTMTDQVKEFQSKTIELSEQNFNLVNQIKSQRNQFQQQQADLQTKYAESREQIKRFSELLRLKEQEIQGLIKQRKVFELNLQTLMSQNQILSDQNMLISTYMSQKQSEIKSLKEITLESEKQVESLRIQMQIVKKDYHNVVNQYSNYRQSNNDAARWIICQLGEEEPIVQSKIILFPQENLRNLQIQAIKNRNMLISKMKSSLKSIKQQKDFITYELQKIGQQLIDSTNDYQQQLQRERNSKDIAVKQLMAEKNALLHQIEENHNEVRELKDKNENYFKLNRLLEHQQEQVQRQKISLLQQKIELIEKIKDLQTQLSQLTLQNANLTRQITKKDALLREQNEQSINQQQKNKYEQEVGFLKLKIAARETQVKQAHQKMKDLDERCILAQSQKRMLQFSLSVKQQLANTLQNKLDEAQRLKAELSSKIKQIEGELQKKEKCLIQNQLSYLQLQNNKAEYQRKNKEITEINQQLQEKLVICRQELLAKNEELKHCKLKAKEGDDALIKSKQAIEGELSKAVGQISIYKFLVQQSQVKINEMRDQIDTLHRQLQCRRQLIIKIESDYEMVQKQVYFEQSHKNTLQRQYQEVQQNYEHAKSEIYLLEQQKLKLTNQIQALKQQNYLTSKKTEESMENSRLRSTKQLIDLKKKLQSEQQKNTKLQMKYQELASYLKKVQSTVEMSQFQLLLCQQQKQKIRCEYEEEIERLQLQMQKMQQKHEQVSGDYKQQREHMMRQIEQLNHQCTQLNNLIRKKQSELEQHHKKEDSSLRKIQYLESEIKQMQAPKGSIHSILTPQSIKHVVSELDVSSIIDDKQKKTSISFIQ